MESGEKKTSKAQITLFSKIGKINSQISTNKSKTSQPKTDDKLSTNQPSAIADIAARISPISYLAYLLLPSVVKAQPIEPAANSTNTIVTKTGDRFNIQGGRLSRDGANLFHSFREFNLYKGQTANFSSTEKIRNIITRVEGGNSSFINGLIQITGGNSNLYIMNPAGILFGKNAQLNLPAAFSATTATGIGFNNHWFNATGENNYAQLLGNPSAFSFPKASAAIINNGNLAVKPGANINLIGGSVINNGTLRAPGGEIGIAAVPNQGIVRITQEGHLLSLEIPSDRLQDTPEGRSIAPLSLPKMLTGESPKGHATGVTINKNGQLVLTGDETVATTPGSVVISGNIDASATQVTRRSLPALNTEAVGGKVEILGDRITLNQADINVSGDAGGGTVNLGNHQLNSNPTSGRENNSQIHVSRDSVISADANVSGRGGKVAIAGEQINISGHISARGSSNSGKGGSVEISGGGDFSGTVDLSSDNHHVGEVRLESENITVNSENIDFRVSDAENHQLTNLTVGENSLEKMTNNADVVLSATNNININNLSDNQLNLNANNYRAAMAQTTVKFVADSDRDRRGSFAIDNRTSIVTRTNSLTISGENLTVGRITGNGGGTINLMSNQINFSRGINSLDNSGGKVNIQPRYPAQNLVITEDINREENVNHNLVETADYPSELGELEDTNITRHAQGKNVDNAREKNSLNLNRELTSEKKLPTIIPQSQNIILATLNRSISPVKIDKIRSQALADELKINLDNFQAITEISIRESLNAVTNQIGKRPAVIYLVAHPEYLELILVTAKGAPVFHKIALANDDELRQEMRNFIGGVSHPSPNNPNKYLTAAQKLYEWLIAPLEAELEKRQIDMLLFSLDPAMRSIPFAALHDGEKFLIEKYSMALIPSINLTDTSYKNLKNLSVLAMGAADFQDHNIVSLPAVPLELKMIRQNWRGKIFFDESFTLENLKQQRIQEGAGIVHLATHGSFKPTAPNESFIQLWNTKLKFDELRELAKNGEPIELLVLSACETAFGNVDAELGFAGLAVQAGVKSVLASLWQVNDGGTLGLMTEFYRHLSLQQTTVKAEALRQAQIAMINGNLRLEAGRLRSDRLGDDGVKLPDSEYQQDMSFSHPYYWASFMMIGTPW